MFYVSVAFCRAALITISIKVLVCMTDSALRRLLLLLGCKAKLGNGLDALARDDAKKTDYLENASCRGTNPATQD
jgi:hypothetical protein